MEPHSHPRAGTPEQANETQETAANQKSQNDVTANRTEDKKSHDQQVSVEHPGARHDIDNKNSEKEEKNLCESESKKVDSNDKVPAGEKNTENNASNKKTSRSCILI